MGLPGGVNQHQPTQHVIPIVYTSYPRSSEFMGSGTLTHCANIDVMIKRRLHITLSLTPRPQCTNPLCDGPYPIPSQCVACWPPQGRQTKTLKQHEHAHKAKQNKRIACRGPCELTQCSPMPRGSPGVARPLVAQAFSRSIRHISCRINPRSTRSTTGRAGSCRIRP